MLLRGCKVQLLLLAFWHGCGSMCETNEVCLRGMLACVSIDLDKLRSVHVMLVAGMYFPFCAKMYLLLLCASSPTIEQTFYVADLQVLLALHRQHPRLSRSRGPRRRAPRAASKACSGARRPRPRSAPAAKQRTAALLPGAPMTDWRARRRMHPQSRLRLRPGSRAWQRRKTAWLGTAQSAICLTGLHAVEARLRQALKRPCRDVG